MLKLEKGRCKEVNITLYRPTAFWNKIFCQAFMCALGMHLMAISFFHIHNIIFSSETILPPVLVEIDRNLIANESDAEMSAHIEEIKYARHLLIPKASDPELPAIDLKIEPIKFEYLSEPIQRIDLFANIEELDPTFPPPLPTRTSVEIFVAGSLAEIPIIDLNELQHETLLQEHQSIHTYEVRASATTGQIFWYTAKESHENVEGVRKAEQILSHLQFQMDSSLFAISGEITIVLHPFIVEEI